MSPPLKSTDSSTWPCAPRVSDWVVAGASTTERCSDSTNTVTATLDWYLAATMHFLQRRHTSSAFLLQCPHARKMEIARSYMQQQHSAFVNISRAWGDRVVVITSDLGKLLAWLPEMEAWSQLL